MKRSELVVGAVVAHSTYQDWQDGGFVYPVTVVDTRAFSARRYRGTALIPLEDGTSPAETLYYTVSPGKQTALVRNSQGQLKLVPLGQLKGDYEACKSLVDARYRARRQREAEAATQRATTRQRVHAAATQLKELGVPIGYISEYDEKLALNATQLEKILELLSAKG